MKLIKLYVLWLLISLPILTIICNSSSYRQAEVGEECKIITVDSCEYILFIGNNNELRYDGIIHKGNCKNH